MREIVMAAAVTAAAALAIPAVSSASVWSVPTWCPSTTCQAALSADDRRGAPEPSAIAGRATVLRRLEIADLRW